MKIKVESTKKITKIISFDKDVAYFRDVYKGTYFNTSYQYKVEKTLKGYKITTVQITRYADSTEAFYSIGVEEVKNINDSNISSNVLMFKKNHSTAAMYSLSVGAVMQYAKRALSD